MVQLFIFLLAFGSLNCAPSSSPADEASDEVVDNGEGVHHPEAVAGDLNNFLNVIQNVSSPTPTPKHPKDLRLGDEVNRKVLSFKLLTIIFRTRTRSVLMTRVQTLKMRRGLMLKDRKPQGL